MSTESGVWEIERAREIKRAWEIGLRETGGRRTHRCAPSFARDASTWRLQTGMGVLTAFARPDLPGDAIAAVIRPEGVRLTASGALASGIVTATTYRGSDLLADIRVGDQRITASLTGTARHTTRIGDAVSITIAPEAIWLIPDHTKKDHA